MSNTATNNILLALKLTTKDFKTEMQGALTLLTNFEKAVKNVKFFPVIDSTSVKNNINTILTQTKDSINQERSAKKASNDEDLKQKRINAQFEKDFNKLVAEEQKAAKRKANQEYEQAFNKLVEAEKKAIADKVAANKKASQESQQLMDAEFQRLRNNQQKFYADKSQAEKSFNDIVKNNTKALSDAEKQNNAKIAAEKLSAEKALNAIKNSNAKTVQNAPALDLKNQIKDIQARTSALKQDKAELQLNISSLNALKNSIKGNSTEEQKLKHDIDQSIASLNRKKIALDGNINDLNRERLAIQGNQHSIVSQNSAIQTNVTELHRQRDALNQTTTASNKAESATKGLAGSFSLSVAAGNLLSRAVTAAYGAMTAEIHKLFEEYIKLESKILSVQGQFGDSVGTYEELGAKIVETADKLSQSGLDAATSFAKFRPIVDDTKLALEGYTQAQIEATAVHAQLSTITKSDINLIKIYGIEVEDLASVHNSLNKAQKFSNATTEEFFRNLPTVTIAAGNAGVSIRQMAVEYSILTNTMKSPAIAATSYQALINYIEKSEDLKKRVENLNKSTGSNIKYGASAIRDAGGVLEWARLLKTAFEKTTDASDNFMKSIRLTQAGKAIQGLIAADRPNEQRADKKSLAQRAIEDSKKELNLLKQQYDKSIDTIENRLSGFKNSFNNIWMQFLIRHEKTIKQVMDGTENLINKLMGWGVQFKNFSVEIFNQLKSIFIGTDLSEIGNTSIQIMEAIAHSAGNLIRKLVSDLDVLIKTGEYTVAKTRSIWEKANYLRYVATKGKTAADEYVAYFQEQADAKEAAMDLAINKNKRFNEKFFKEFGTFIEPEAKKVIHQKPTEQVPIKLKNQNKEYVAPIAAKNGNIEILDGKKLKEAENQAKKDASLLEKYNTLKGQLEQDIKVIEEDNTLEKALKKINAKYFKIRQEAENDLVKAKNIDTRKAIVSALAQLTKNQIADLKDSKSEFGKKAAEVLTSIDTADKDLTQRIKDIAEGSNFSTVFALNDFKNDFNKDNKFTALLEKYGFSKAAAEQAVKQLKDDLKILETKSREAFKKSKEEFNSKFQQKGDTELANSQTDLKDEQLRAKKAKTENLVIFKSSVEDEKVILKERLSAKLNEIDQEKAAKEQQITDEINAQIKKFGKSKDLDQQLKDRLLKLDSQYEVIRETARTKEFNDKSALEIQAYETSKRLKQKEIQDEYDYLKFKLDNYATITQAAKDLGDSLLSSSNATVQALGTALDSFGNIGTQGLSLLNQANSFTQQKKEITGPKDFVSLKGVENNQALGKINASEQSAALSAGIQMAAQEVAKSISVIIQNYEKFDKQNQKVTQTIKVFGESSTQAKQAMMGLNETFADSLKMIPIFGDLISSATRAVTDFFGATVSEKDKKIVKDLEDATNHLTKVRLENGAKTLQNELAILEQEKKENLQNLVDKGLDNEAFEKERLALTEEFAAKRLKVEKDYYAELVKTQQDLEFAKMGIQKGSYENQGRELDLNYQNKISEIRDKYNPSGEEGFVPSDAQLNEEEAAYLNYLTDRQSLTASEGKKELDINYDNQKSLIELQDDGYNKSIELLEIDIAKRKALVEEDFKEGVISRVQGNRILETIDREYQVSLKKINDDYKEKIRAFNEKSYTAELSVIDKFYGEKRRKLEQDVQHEIDARKDLKQKLKDIDTEREQDQELKEKRAVAFQKALQDQSKGGDFYRIPNPEDFQATYGTERNQVQDSFDLGVGQYKNYDAYAQKRQELGVSTYQFYSHLAENETDSAKKDEYLRQAKAGADEFYEFIFDKSKESIENEIKASTKRETDKRAELLKTTDLEKAEIAKLDQAYKDSSGLYKDSFVQATQVWTKFAQDAINDIDLSNLIGKVKNDIAEIKKDADKLGGSGVTPSATSPSSPSSGTRDTSTTPKAGETWEEAIARFKREDAAKNNANHASSGGSSASNPSVATYANNNYTGGSDPRKNQIFMDMARNSPSKTPGEYDEMYGYKTVPELEALARLRGIPGYKVGTDYVPRTGFALLHEGERVVTAQDNAKDNYMRTSYPGKNNSSIINSNNTSTQVINMSNQVTISGGNPQEMKKQFDAFENKLKVSLSKLGIG